MHNCTTILWPANLFQWLKCVNKRHMKAVSYAWPCHYYWFNWFYSEIVPLPSAIIGGIVVWVVTVVGWLDDADWNVGLAVVDRLVVVVDGPVVEVDWLVIVVDGILVVVVTVVVVFVVDWVVVVEAVVVVVRDVRAGQDLQHKLFMVESAQSESCIVWQIAPLSPYSQPKKRPMLTAINGADTPCTNHKQHFCCCDGSSVMCH